MVSGFLMMVLFVCLAGEQFVCRFMQERVKDGQAEIELNRIVQELVVGSLFRQFCSTHFFGAFDASLLPVSALAYFHFLSNEFRAARDMVVKILFHPEMA